MTEPHFTRDPPNATVSVLGTHGSKLRDAVVVLKTAKLEKPPADLMSMYSKAIWPAALFIDRFGFGGYHRWFPPVGFRGGSDLMGTVSVGRVGVDRVGAVGLWRRPYVARGA